MVHQDAISLVLGAFGRGPSLPTDFALPWKLTVFLDLIRGPLNYSPLICTFDTLDFYR